MEKLFSVAGTSALEGVVKFRVANGSASARTKVLVRSGHTDIKLVDLTKPMSKTDAIAFVKSQGFIAAVETPTATKAPKQKTVKLTTIVKKVSKKFAAEKSVRAINASFAAKTAEAPAAETQPTANSIAEIAKIKAKNLETMRRVSNKLAALRSY